MMMLDMIRPALDRRAARAIAQGQICATLIEEVLAAPLPEQERRYLQHAFVVIEAGKLFTASADTAIDQALYGLVTALDDGVGGFALHGHERRTLQEAFDALYALAGMLETISDASPQMSRETRLQAVA